MAKYLRRIFFLPFCTTFSTLVTTGVLIIFLWHHVLLTSGSPIPGFSEQAAAIAKEGIQELGINSAQLNENGQNGYGDGWIDLSYSSDNRDKKKENEDNNENEHENQNEKNNQGQGVVNIWDEEMKQATTVDEIENTMPRNFPTTFTVLGIIFIIVVIIIGICAVVVLIISD